MYIHMYIKAYNTIIFWYILQSRYLLRILVVSCYFTNILNKNLLDFTRLYQLHYFYFYENKYNHFNNSLHILNGITILNIIDFTNQYIFALVSASKAKSMYKFCSI